MLSTLCTEHEENEMPGLAVRTPTGPTSSGPLRKGDRASSSTARLGWRLSLMNGCRWQEKRHARYTGCALFLLLRPVRSQRIGFHLCSCRRLLSIDERDDR